MPTPVRTVYLFALIAALQHGTVLPVVEIQTILCEGLILFTAEYTQTDESDLKIKIQD